MTDPSESVTCIYVVVHREEGVAHRLGEVHDVRRHHRVLDPWTSRVRQQGGTGEVLLVEKDSGLVVARQAITAAKPTRRTYRPRSNAAAVYRRRRATQMMQHQAAGHEADDTAGEQDA